MHLSSAITRGAIRFFSLAVDNKFNRGRKTDYIIASCLYLQCRLKKDAHMLIDFSEHKGVSFKQKCPAECTTANIADR